MRHDLSAFSRRRMARSRSSSFRTVTTGRSLNSVKRQIPSSLPSTPSASRLKDANPRWDFSAIPEKVLTKQLATAATRKCSGVQRPGSPNNSGGALTDIQDTRADSFRVDDAIASARAECVDSIFVMSFHFLFLASSQREIASDSGPALAIQT